MSLEQPAAHATAAEPELARDHVWQRLDPRMLLVHPIRELIRFLPVLIGLFLAGSASDEGAPWHLIGVAFPIALGLLRYLTTSFRVGDGRVELRRGLLSRHTLSTPIDRVRTVDLTSSPIHRFLGLTTVRIGTGTASNDDDDELDLDGLPVTRARELRRELLHTSPAADEPSVSRPAGRELVRFDPTWLRFAPFTGSGVVIAAAVLGAGSQVLNAFDAWNDVDPTSWSLPVPAAGAIVLLAVGLLVVVAVLSVIGYLVTNWAFRLTLADGSWHVTRGLLTTRETSLDEDRVAGLSLGEPLALRLAGGRHLDAIVTGVDRRRSGSAMLVPPSGRDVAARVAAAVVHSDRPMTAALHGHGPAARRRRYVRALLPAVVVSGAVGVAVVAGAPWWLLLPAAAVVPAAVGLAVDRDRGLGHALVAGYLVARSGSIARQREALAVDHIIGWSLRSTWFQRRAGLTTLVATTAGGSGSVTVLDVPEPDAVRLADESLPHLVSQFLR